MRVIIITEKCLRGHDGEAVCASNSGYKKERNKNSAGITVCVFVEGKEQKTEGSERVVR